MYYTFTKHIYRPIGNPRVGARAAPRREPPRKAVVAPNRVGRDQGREAPAGGRNRGQFNYLDKGPGRDRAGDKDKGKEKKKVSV